MANDMERKIAERAYQIWDEEGRLLGRDKEHWAQARRDHAVRACKSTHNLTPIKTPSRIAVDTKDDRTGALVNVVITKGTGLPKMRC